MFGTANLLTNGRVLITGSGSAELYRPQHQDFIAAGNLQDGRHNSSVSLNNGNVLFYGGGTNTVELYRWRKGTFTFVPGTVSTDIDGAVIVKSGQVLLLGDPLEIYRPVHNDVIDLNLFIPPFDVGAQLPPNGGVGLNDGRALISWASQVPFSQLADFVNTAPGPSASLTTGPPMGLPPVGGYTVTKLHNGEVLFAGGNGEGVQVNALTLHQSVVYDPTSNSFITTTQPDAQCKNACAIQIDGTQICGPVDCADDRSGAAATQLQGRKALITGGLVFPYDGSTGTAAGTRTAWLFDPLTNQFSPTAGQMTTPRFLHTNTLLCQ